ncbi:MAG TPA: RsmE family RNA methyltransferase [Ktedonobacterales bacterium]|jgi:16S rRNA (uracil1498-N3)-methyltransferase
MHRFFITPELFASDTPTLPAQIARQINTVLRLRPGEQIIILDGQGMEADLELTEVSSAAVAGRVVERRPSQGEPRARLVLCQGLLKAEAFEWVLQKGTELGVSAFVPVLSRRSMPGLEEISPAKMDRWRTILREAAEQCRRGLIPTLSQVQPLMHALASRPADALAFMPWEECSGPSLQNAMRAALANASSAPTPSVYLFIGPRDGLLAEEVQLAERHGVQAVTLGQRILRAETAALAAATIVLSEFGEMG